MTAEELKDDEATSSHLRNADAHPTDSQLQQMADECQEYVDLMQDSMPHECQLAVHFEWIRTHLLQLRER